MTAGEVDPVERGVDAELAAVPGRVGHLGGVQDRLGRDAAAMQAGAADLVLLDQGDPQTELGGAQRARVAAAAGPEDDHVRLTMRLSHEDKLSPLAGTTNRHRGRAH